MATYNGWTEMREYRVWQAEDLWANTTVSRHINGWYQVDTDGYDVPYKTRSESDAFLCAASRTRTCEEEAKTSCPCGEPAEECGEVYNAPHAVRTQVIDCEENRELDF